MSEERKKRNGPWIAGLLVALPVLYIASFGPACWWVSRPSPNLYPDAFGRSHPLPFAPRIYFPIGWIFAHGPKCLAAPIEWYGTLGTPCVGVGEVWGEETGVVLQRK